VAQWLTEGDNVELAKLAKLLSVKNYSAKTVAANRGALARVMAQRVLRGLEWIYALTLYTLSVCPDMHP
jgi:hypothetical protein